MIQPVSMWINWLSICAMLAIGALPLGLHLQPRREEPVALIAVFGGSKDPLRIAAEQGGAILDIRDGGRLVVVDNGAITAPFGVLAVRAGALPFCNSMAPKE